jgi:hypothetical protein
MRGIIITYPLAVNQILIFVGADRKSESKFVVTLSSIIDLESHFFLVLPLVPTTNELNFLGFFSLSGPPYEIDQFC